MRLRLPDLSGYKEKMKISSVFKRVPSFPQPLKGGIFRFLRPAWLCAVLLALFAAFLTNSLLEGFLLNALFETQTDLARMVNGRTPSLLLVQSQKKQGNEVSFVPFNVAGKAANARAVQPQKAIGDILLVGTLPNIGAWLNTGSGTLLVLKDQDYNGYKLELVSTGRVLLTKDGDSFPLYLELGGKSKAKDQASSANTRNTTPDPGNRSARDSGIVQATEGNPGSIKRELLDSLLMNPYEEIRKINLTAAADGKGMRLVRVGDTSFLSQLGMQVGDVLTGVNGNSIINMANLNNAIASMLNSSEFNLEFTREGKPVQLGYTVK